MTHDLENLEPGEPAGTRKSTARKRERSRKCPACGRMTLKKGPNGLSCTKCRYENLTPEALADRQRRAEP